MKASIRCCVVAVLALLVLAGCEVTEEKIDLWKGTQNGPKKLASTVVDSDVQMNLRAKAAVALVEINAWDLFRELFKKMEKSDAESVVTAVTPILAKMVEEGGSKEKPISKLQVDAKDALFIMLDYAGGEGKAAAERALIGWCTGDYNVRAMAGQYNIRTIVKKIGAPAADGLIPLLNVKAIVIKHVAELIREVKDERVLAKASQQLAADLKANIAGIKEIHLIAAAIIGGGPIGDALLDFATNKDLSDKLQRFSLRAFSESMSKKAITLSSEQVDKLFSMAQDLNFDQYQREETYYVIAQAGRKDDLERFFKLLTEKSSFWRAVGLRCILRIDGEGQLNKALQDIAKQTTDKSHVDEVIARIKSFPKLLPKVRELLGDSSGFSKGIAVGVLGEMGNKDDLKKLEQLSGKTRLPKGFGHKTLGEAVKAAVEAIKKRG
ncbi:MAG: hypothetical protein GY854_13545 [Deltaproteobacteria bacterium]|nr:hypothetical protein [Deltaproteobacteria bacterium]